MNGTIDDLIPDWREKINESGIGSIKNNMAEMLPILKQLVKDRNIEGIQEFYQKVCTDTVDMNDDRDPFFYKFLMQFCNVESCDGVMEERPEPITKHHFLCFKCVYHRGEEDEFSVIIFFKKWDEIFPEYKYLCFLMYNNLVGMETYLHTYEFKEPIFDEKYMVQCNNLVLSFKLEGTEQENLLYPAIHYNEDWISFIYDKLEEMGLYARNVLINGEDLAVVIDLWRSITLKSNSLKYILGKVEEQLLLHLQDYYVYDNEHFFMVPGSINARKQISINRKTKLMFSNKNIEGDTLVKREDGYYRCYYVGMDVYPFPAVSLSKLAESVGFPKKEKQEDTDKRKRIEYKKRFTRVGRERLEDLDKLVELRQDEIRERFHFFRIMGNILFYLGKEPAEVLQYMNDRNKRLYVNTSNVTNMYQMFSNCYALTALDVIGFNTSKVTNMFSMFATCSSLTNLDLSNFDTGNVTNMSAMFMNDRALSSLDVSSFETSNVTDMSQMFCQLDVLTSLDLSNFDTHKVTDMSSMFYNCPALKTIYVTEEKWSTSKAKVTSMFTYSGTSEVTYK